MAEQSIVHIRRASWGDGLTYCDATGGSISEDHYRKGIVNELIARHIASLRMCPECIKLIEEFWPESFKLLRERANK